MLNTKDLSESKRALLAKYMRGDLLKSAANKDSIARRTQEGPAPLSFGQQQLWLLAQLMPDSPVYTECVTLHLPGSLDVAILEQSYNEILRRHEAWRTSFPLVDGQPVQLVHLASPISLPVVDLRYLPEAEREAEALRLMAEDAQRPFDIVNGPLQRATLVCMGDEQHRLFLTLHHIIFDGFSLYQVFLSELRTIYDAFLKGEPSPLPELPVQYRDVAAWQRERMQGEMLAEQLTYWQQQLAGSPELLALPADHPRPATPSYRGAIQQVALSERLTGALRAMSRKEGVTLYTTLLASFNTLLYRYTGQDDILIGTASAGRNRTEFQHMLGVFINMLVLRTHVTGDLSFRDLLRRAQQITLEAQTYQDVPFEYLVKELQPERKAGQNPLFQVALTLEPPLAALPSGWTLTHMEGETGTTKFDLSLVIEDRPEGLICRFQYSTDLFDAPTIARMAGHWQTILESVVSDPAQLVGQLPLLTEAERHQLLVEWNETAVNYPEDMCIHQLIEAQVRRTPEAIALVFEDQQLTYQQLNARANQLAHYLQQRGVGTEALVGICMERSLEMIVALLAILKAGGAYVPLDPTLPEDRLVFMIEDTRMPLLLTQRQLAPSLPDHQLKVVCLDEDWEAIAQESADNLGSKVTPTNLAYVIYTSGSTGRPKGVAIEHMPLLNYLNAMLEVLALPAKASFALVSTFAADLGNTMIFPALCSGGCLHVISQERASDPVAFGEYFNLHHIDCLKITPSHLTALLTSPRPEHVLPRLRLILGGEASSWNLIERLQLLAPDCTIINHYGPTETTVGVLTCQVEKGVKNNHPATLPLGRPLANIQTYILDRQRQPVPVGVPGELHIGGVSLARGYLNRPELTAEKFIVHPWSSQPNARLYRTGDLARYQANGAVEFLGRIDQQVKIRGFRVEPGEIEAVLRQHPAVREAVVIAREETPDNKYLVAYIVPTLEYASTAALIHDYLTEKLPAYMVPASFMMLDALPLTTNGKVDRRALPAPDMSRRSVEETFAIPYLPVHFQLIKVWEELLDARPIGIRDNFFFLGGHSLLAARLVARMDQVFGKKIPLATLFTHPTIEQLARVLLEREDIQPSSPIVAVQTHGTRRPFFYLHGDYKSGAFYCLPLVRNLGNDQPFYTLEPPGVDGSQFPSSMEEMATTNIQFMKTIQSAGPYLLGGFCNGGLIAYEMARQLHAQGEQVDLLLLLDPTPVGEGKLVNHLVNHAGNLMHLSQQQQLYWFLWLRHAYKYLLHFYRYVKYPHYRGLQAELNAEQVYAEGGIVAALKTLFELQCGNGIKHWQSSKQVESDSKPGTLHAMLLKIGSIFPDPFFPSFERLARSWEGMFHWLVADYVPDFYAGKSTFFFFEDGERRKKKWRKLALAKDAEVEIHTVAGTHDTCKTEYLDSLTERMRLCLDRVQEDTSTKRER